MDPPSPYTAHLMGEVQREGGGNISRVLCSREKGTLPSVYTLYFETFGLVCFLQKREGMEVPLSAPSLMEKASLPLVCWFDRQGKSSIWGGPSQLED